MGKFVCEMGGEPHELDDVDNPEVEDASEPSPGTDKPSKCTGPPATLFARVQLCHKHMPVTDSTNWSCLEPSLSAPACPLHPPPKSHTFCTQLSIHVCHHSRVVPLSSHRILLLSVVVIRLLQDVAPFQMQSRGVSECPEIGGLNAQQSAILVSTGCIAHMHSLQ